MVMTTYELLYLTPILDRDADRTDVSQRIGAIIQDAGGTIVATREVGRQRLAYPIGHRDSGEYTLVEFTAASHVPAAINRELRLQDGVLRYVCTVKQAKARVLGAAVEAMERAQEQRDAARAARTSAAGDVAPVAAQPEVIENLDEKLDAILGKEMV